MRDTTVELDDTGYEMAMIITFTMIFIGLLALSLLGVMLV